MLGLVMVALLAGCSIEKRHYRGGYYIKWHKRHSGSKNQAKAEKEIDSSLVVIRKDSVVLDPLEADTVSIIANQEEEVSQQVDTVDESDQEEQLKPVDLPRKKRRFEPLGVLSSKILLINVVLALIIETTLNHNEYRFYLVLFYAVLIVVFITAITSMVRYLRNPRHYKFNIWAIIGILVPLFFFVIFGISLFPLF